MSRTRRLATSIVRASRRAGAAAPEVRGADWRIAIVTAVGTPSGTVTCGTITARRLASYSSPTVGQKIVISQSGSGNWLALGPMAT